MTPRPRSTAPAPAETPAAAVLDNPAWAALTGPHAPLAERYGRAARYPRDTAPFAALADPEDPRSWADLAALAGPGARVTLTGRPVPPPDWELLGSVEGVQLTGEAVRAAPDPEAVPLGPADVPEIMRLVELTRPGPFRDRTVELGGYLGIRSGGRLVALAGGRMRPPGWTEISAVCTHPDHRGRGLARRLVRAVAAVARERGEVPFLHAAAENTGAVRLYEELGFALRARPVFMAVRTPGPALPDPS
ncbi:GNAT family N-acetyltransferase [Streptomyces sp. NPDC097619]|uniref:GNAT family N-acetyltransferase n=1 Tax=Streptomyces sp. NPDC097619 TaxID=3157228 RepID=UPI003318FBF0